MIFRPVKTAKFIAGGIAFAATGCMPADIEGNAYIVKGGGDIKPAAGQELILLPYESSEALAEFLFEEASSKALEQKASTFSGVCSDANEALPDIVASLEERRQTLEQKDVIPLGGCESLDAELASANEISDSETQQLRSELSLLNEEKLRLDREYSDLLDQRAQSLKQDALTKVSASFSRRYLNSYFDLSISNKSEYCIFDADKNYKVELFQNTRDKKEIFSVAIPAWNFDEAEDRFGFEKGCNIEAGKRQSITSLTAPGVDSDSMRLRVERDGIKTFTPRFESELVSIDGAQFSEVDFFTLSSRESGDRVIWTKQKVDWREEAKENFTPDVLNQISEVEQKIAALQTQIAEIPAVQLSTRLTDEVEVCRTTVADLEFIEQSVDSLSRAGRVIERCELELDGLAELRMSLEAVNDLSNTYRPAPSVSFGRTEIETEFMALLSRESTLSTVVTMDGSFRFEGVPRGNYLILGDYSDNFVDVAWLVPVRAGTDEQIELNNRNSTDAEDILEALGVGFSRVELGTFDDAAIGRGGSITDAGNSAGAFSSEPDPDCLEGAARTFDKCINVGNSRELCEGARKINEDLCDT